MTTSTAHEFKQQDGETTEPAAPGESPRQIPDMPRRWFLLTMGTAAVTTAFKANIAADSFLT